MFSEIIAGLLIGAVLIFLCYTIINFFLPKKKPEIQENKKEIHWVGRDNLE